MFVVVGRDTDLAVCLIVEQLRISDAIFMEGMFAKHLRSMCMAIRNRFTLAARIQNGASRDVVGVLGMNAGRVARRSRLGLTLLIM